MESSAKVISWSSLFHCAWYLAKTAPPIKGGISNLFEIAWIAENNLEHSRDE